MNASIIAGISGGTIIVVLGVLIALDANAGQQLQFMVIENEEFDFMSLSMDSTYAVCNPSSFPTSFDKIYAQLYYKSNEIADFTIWGTDIPANQAKEVQGRININGQTLFQMFLGAFAGSFSGQSPEFDERDVSINLKVEKSILGFIPYTLEKEVTGGNLGGWNEIQQMFGTSSQREWNCSYPSKFIDNVRTTQSDNPSLDSSLDTSKEKLDLNEEKSYIGSEQEFEANKGHMDAVILVKIFGDRFDFSLPAYQEKSSAIYFSGDGHTIHTYKSSTVDIPYMFETLGMKLTDDCLIFQDGREFCNNDKYILEFYLNGVELDSLDDVPLANNDKIMILYGSDQSLNNEMSELNALRPIHRYQ